MTKATEPRERTIDKFHNSLLSLGIEPPYHGDKIDVQHFVH